MPKPEDFAAGKLPTNNSLLIISGNDPTVAHFLRAISEANDSKRGFGQARSQFEKNIDYTDACTTKTTPLALRVNVPSGNLRRQIFAHLPIAGEAANAQDISGTNLRANPTSLKFYKGGYLLGELPLEMSGQEKQVTRNTLSQGLQYSASIALPSSDNYTSVANTNAQSASESVLVSLVTASQVYYKFLVAKTCDFYCDCDMIELHSALAPCIDAMESPNFNHIASYLGVKTLP